MKATVSSVSAKDHGLRGEQPERELLGDVLGTPLGPNFVPAAASVYDYDYNGYGTGGIAPSVFDPIDNGYGPGPMGPGPMVGGWIGLAGGVSGGYTGLAGYNDGYNSGGYGGYGGAGRTYGSFEGVSGSYTGLAGGVSPAFHSGGVRGGAGPNFVPAGGAGPNFVPADNSRTRYTFFGNENNSPRNYGNGYGNGYGGWIPAGG